VKLNHSTLIILCILSGLLLGSSFGTRVYFPVAFFAFIPLLFIEDYFSKHKLQFTNKLAFSYFYLSFIFFNLSAAWWTYNSSPIGSLAVILLNSLYLALAFALYYFIKKTIPEFFHGLLFISIWITAEYIHYNWELAWPWLTLGNGLANQIKLIQWYEFTGVLSGSFWILITNYLLYKWLHNYLILKNKAHYKFLFLTFFILLAPILTSIYLFNNYREIKNPVHIALVQPNFASYTEKYKIENSVQIQRIIQLSDSIVDSNTNYIIAPETAISELVNQDSLSSGLNLQPVILFVKKHPSLHYIIGISSYKPVSNFKNKTQYIKQFPNGNYYKAYNTFLQIDSSLHFQMHQKSKFVLGVEKMPFGNTFSFFENYAFNLGGVVGSIVPDSTEQPLTNSDNNTIITPLVCFESAFGSYVTEFVRKKANLIFIITNDDWWGDTPGYKQHFMNARLRAIENRRSVARAANTGISAFINQKGEVLKATKWKETISIKGVINKNNKLTFYTKHGDYIGVFFSIISLLGFLNFLIYSFREKILGKIK